MSALCLVQLAVLVVTFEAPDSVANFSSKAASNSSDLSSFLLHFKTSQANTRIASVTDVGGELFAVDIRSGYLQIVYNLNGPGNGTTNLRSNLVNTSEWFLLNISSNSINDTRISMTKSNQAVSLPCVADHTTTTNTSLLGNGFQNLFRKAGMAIGGKTNDESLKPFDGCIGTIELGGHPVVLFNRSQGGDTDMYFTRYSTGLTEGCSCLQGACENGIYIWDPMTGSCACKCNEKYKGTYCNITLAEDDNEIDEELVYLVAGITGGVLAFVVCVVCIFLFCKRTSSANMGVYNPKSEEQIQGRQMNTTMQVPAPEKLI